MELVEGDDLAQRPTRGAMPLDEALPIAQQVAEVLEAAHEAGIIHRDLKPANIKVRPDCTVKVLDFGLAKSGALGAPGGPGAPGAGAPGATVTSPAVTMQGVILGTAAYMAPEQARGMPVDHRADLWAFGCVLFEMLAGARPFAGDPVTDILAGIVKEEPSWGCASSQDARRNPAATALPAEGQTQAPFIGGGCQARDRGRTQRRPRSSDADSATSAAASSRVGCSGRCRDRHGRGRLSAGHPDRDRCDSAAPMTRFVIPAPPGTQIVATHREVALSPDGRQVAFIARGATDQHIYVRRLDDLTPRLVPGTEGARDLTFSPDGRWLAFHAGNRIRKVSLAGGQRYGVSVHHRLKWIGTAPVFTITALFRRASTIQKCRTTEPSPTPRAAPQAPRRGTSSTAHRAMAS
jgi:hypothetical protein